MIETMLNRRSVRRFSDRPVEEEKLQLLLRAAMQAPSAKNAQPWEFLVVKDKEVLEALAKAQPYAMAIKNAPLGIVTLCNKARYTDNLDAFWQEDLSAVTQPSFWRPPNWGWELPGWRWLRWRNASSMSRSCFPCRKRLSPLRCSLWGTPCSSVTRLPGLTQAGSTAPAGLRWRGRSSADALWTPPISVLYFIV